jgi:hypothetical protein
MHAESESEPEASQTAPQDDALLGSSDQAAARISKEALRGKAPITSDATATGAAAEVDAPPSQLSGPERAEKLARIVSARALEGWVVIDKNDRDASAVLMLPGKPVNHVLHFIIGLFTCGVWWIVWLMLAATQRREQRVRLSMDAYGNLLEEKMG